jgi:ribosomal protein S18 acetylase RimI-like enzyme
MKTVSSLPSGLTGRGATLDDVAIVTQMTNAAENVDAGEPSMTSQDIESDWQLPGFDPSKDVLLVYNGDQLVAEAEVPGWRAVANVHPEARGRGIGTAVLAWVEERALARQPGADEVRVGQTVIDTNVDAISLLKRHGHTKRHTSWALRLPEDVTIEDRSLPAGYAIRPFDPLTEAEIVFQVEEDAFSEWPTREPSSFDEWKASVLDRSDFDPSLLLVATHHDEVIAMAFGIPYEDEGWVQSLAVRTDHRGKGFAKALLREQFETFRARGFPAVGLSTDSRTGVLDLYLNVGMVVRQSYTHYSKLLNREYASETNPTSVTRN